MDDAGGLAPVVLAAGTRVSITDTDAPNGYPTDGFAWMPVYENLDQNDGIQTREQAEALVRLIVWAITDAQELAEGLDFSRIPERVVELNLAMIRELKWQGEAVGEEVLENVTADN